MLQAGAIAAACALGCTQSAPTRVALPPSTVTVAHPVRQSVTDYHEFTGQTEAVESAEIRARVRGFLQKIDFQEGTEVQQGALLYEIDPREYEAAVAKAQADVAKAQAQLALAQSEEQRTARLRSTNAVTEEEYQQRVATRQQAEAAVKQAQAALALADLDLSYTKIVAPIAGRVSRTRVTVGNLVGYSEPTLLTTVVRLDPIYVYFDAPERNFLEYQELIRKQEAATAEQRKVPLEVELETERDFPHRGVIDFRESRVDATTGTVTIRGVLPNSDRMLVPGLFARIRVPVGAPHDELLVPDAAVASDQRGEYVLAVKGDNTVEYRAVTTGHSKDGLTVVSKGLSETDWVIVNGVQKARPGSPVAPEKTTIQPPAKATAAAPPVEQPVVSQRGSDSGRGEREGKLR